MFHTFQGLAPTPEPAQDSSKPQTHSVAKRITTPHACVECKRRKIRCDGKQPCGQCVGCRSPKQCYYDKHRQRVIPSRKALDALQQSLNECLLILKRLYPTRDPQSLLKLSRSELIALLDGDCTNSVTTTTTTTTTAPPQSPPTTSQSSVTSPEFRSPLTSLSDDEQGLANLEQVPSQNAEWDEERRGREPIPVVADDVNALSLSVDRHSSYLGVSSIRAAIKVMVKVAPKLRSSILSPSSSNRQPPNQASSHQAPHPSSTHKNGNPIRWNSQGQTFIDAYFNRVHVFVPMLDEPSFRSTYLSGRRDDLPWLALLNMVFAMGSISAMKSDDHGHAHFYNSAMKYLDLDSFGTSHLETLQAFALMGGFYLHYVNRPNLATAVMGAAFRMACALGLHREGSKNPNASYEDKLAADLRRRTWWSLYCLDTWGSTTLGRPSLGRSGPGISIRSPEGVGDMSESSIAGQDIRIVPLIENIKFCTIATKLQDTLSLNPLLSDRDRNSFDSELANWIEKLPRILSIPDQCPEALYTVRCVMKWRYQNLRMILHRPLLLSLANRASKALPSPVESASIEICRSIAKETIEDISQEWARNQFSGWNAAWFLYQASMVPLVSLFWEHWNTEKVREWQRQVETVIESLGEMIDWSLAARRSKEVVHRAYDASKKVPTGSVSPRRPVSERSNVSIDGDSIKSLNVNVNKNGVASGSHGGGFANEAQTIDAAGEGEMHPDGLIDASMEEINFLESQGFWDETFWNIADGLDAFDGSPDMDFEALGRITNPYNWMQ